MEETTFGKIITETNKITTFKIFRDLMLEILKGYPKHEYFGKFESVFPNTGKKIVKILTKHKVIERIPIEEVKNHVKIMPQEELQKLPRGENKFIWYRLAPRGVDLAISMVNLKYNENVNKNSNQTLNYSKEMRLFTIMIIILSGLTVISGFIQIFLYLKLI